MDYIEKIEDYEVDNNQLILKGGNWGNIHIRPFSSGVINIEFVRATSWNKSYSPLKSYSVINDYEKDVQFSIKKRKNKIKMIMPKAEVDIRLNPFSITIYRDDHKRYLNHCTFEWDGWKVGLKFLIDKNEHFYGLGETDQNAEKIELDHLGNKYTLWNKHLPAPSRMIFPFTISSKGYGLFIDNYWPAEIDIGSHNLKKFSYVSDGGKLNCYIMIGKSIEDILYKYSKVIGAPTIPPRFVFGLLQSKFGYKSSQEVESIANKYRKKQIPCDGIIIDLYWFNKMGDMSFNKKKFPKPNEMITKLKEKGFHIILIEEPYITKGSRLFEEGKKLEVFGKKSTGEPYIIPFWPGQSAIVDFTNPLAKQWWANQHYNLIDMGVGGWWADLNEPEDHPQDMIHYAGPASKVHNIFALEMMRSIKLAYEQHAPDKRLFIMSRSGWAGMQRYGAGTWSGDVETSWEALSKQIALGLNMGLVGVPYWNTDIGGFIGESVSSELFIRWLQFGAFTPIMRPHGFHAEREPWSFGEEAEIIITEIIKLRYQMIPYLYTLAYEAYEKGLPIMRPLVMYYPDNPVVTNITDQYLFGKDLLVAPILKKGERERTVYLPEGNWYNFWTCEKIYGNQFINVEAPLEQIPIFVKADAILPILPVRNYIDEKEWSELNLLIYPETNSEYLLYEDDGETNDYQEDSFTLIKFISKIDNKRWNLEIEKPKGSYIGQVKKRKYNIMALTENKPKKILVNGVENKSWIYNIDENKLTIEVLTYYKENTLIEVEFCPDMIRLPLH